MRRMEDAKDVYEKVPIPEELSKRVTMEIERSRARRAQEEKMAPEKKPAAEKIYVLGEHERRRESQMAGENQTSKEKRMGREEQNSGAGWMDSGNGAPENGADSERSLPGSRKTRRRSGDAARVRGAVAAAAAVVVVFAAAVNVSPAFAESVSQVPVIGTVAQVLTFRSYDTETEDMKISVDIPSVEMIAEDMKGLETSVNEEIHSLCQQYADEAETRAMEYRQAFLDTGGTAEEWAAHELQIRVWYEVKAHTADYLSLAIMGTENWTTAYSETRYYNFDLKNGAWITLSDVLGADYKRIAEESVRRQMKERMEAEGAEYWPELFTGVDENTKFYMNEAGNPVVVFDKYEIAPGAAGQPEFEVERSQAGTEETAGGGYEDAFSVDSQAAAEFGRQVKKAVADRDLEALADLTAFPVYVGFADGGVSVESREEFLALGADRIFTGELADSVAAADETALSPSMAGFVLAGENGRPNVIFGVRDGKLAVNGINY